MSEKQSDIAERLRVMADDLVLFKEIDTGADDMREAADEIERLRAELDQAVKLAYAAVRAERAAIVAFIDRHKKQRVLADSIWDEGYEAALDSIAAAIKARGET